MGGHYTLACCWLLAVGGDNIKRNNEHQLRWFLLLFLTLFAFAANAQKFTELALTPPMGWNSWNHFGCKGLNEQVVREVADAMVSSGMKEAGYRYIVLDDCWQLARDKHGNIIADSSRFPSGMKALGDYIHSRGLQFGIYSCAGRKTCQELPGSHRYERQDAATYAAWGVDYLKYDWCHHFFLNSKTQYAKMRDALYEAGRPVVFSICEWGTTKPWKWAREVGHLWRTTRDIVDCWDCSKYFGFMDGVTRILDQQAGLEQYAGPGYWNDPDMLEVGNGGMTENEYRAHFSLWCMLAAPLIAGNDLRNMSQGTIDILTNREVIAVDQDSLGAQGYKVVDEGDFEIWMKKLTGNEFAFCFLNRGETEARRIIDWSRFSIPPTYTLRDLWKHADIGETRSSLEITVPVHDVVMLRLIK